MSYRTGLSWKRLSRRFRTPLRTATGEYVVRESLVLRLVDGAGRIGYGEVAPWPGFPVETLAEAEAELAGLASNGSTFSSPACALSEIPGDSSFAFTTSGPCVTAALSHAKAWASDGWGTSAIELPCAGLARNPEHAEEKFLDGFSSVKLKLGGNPLFWPSSGFPYALKELWALMERHPGAVRMDANGTLSAEDFAEWGLMFSAWEPEWIEQPMKPGSESVMIAIARARGLDETRLALDESVSGARDFDEAFPGVRVIKPLLAGNLQDFRTRRAKPPSARIAYSSVFESPFGRQAALCVAAEDAASPHAVGFDTLGVFDDDLDVHAEGPVAKTVARDAAFWERIWNRI